MSDFIVTTPAHENEKVIKAFLEKDGKMYPMGEVENITVEDPEPVPMLGEIQGSFKLCGGWGFLESLANRKTKARVKRETGKSFRSAKRAARYYENWRKK